jgi:hypothetical protein
MLRDVDAEMEAAVGSKCGEHNMTLFSEVCSRAPSLPGRRRNKCGQVAVSSADLHAEQYRMASLG